MDFRLSFIEFAVEQRVLRFGEFTTKAGRLSPYFFNAGLFDHGASLRRLCQFYVQAIEAGGIAFDMLFGSAYKGIPLAAGIALTLAEKGRDLPFAYNRKEAKDHGEGGLLVGAPLAGRVLIVDDVVSAGNSARESVEIIRAAGAEPAGVAVALDRMERGQGDHSATREIEANYGLPVIAIASLDHLLGFLQHHSNLADHAAAVRAYRQRYGSLPDDSSN
ncbi:MAG: orotate phosphoribosyltransferase [Zoogloeaceae bacterium]|jgi:orotate phosphoribosyltransferase|nr:orotate phosphoribosyltransferase [Zoogloeaceae bacterium]